MTKKKRLAREALAKAADAFADEIWAGKWEHLMMKAPIGKQVHLARELERRCPGHDLETYQSAVADAWWRRGR
jgi:hypothetical protein